MTRYLDLSAVSAERRSGFINAFVIAINSTSTSSSFVRPFLVGEDFLRIDLTELRWDSDFRSEELVRLEASGVKFKFKSEAVKAKFLDIWESIGDADPYFRVSHGKIRGWVEPAAYEEARFLSESSKFLVRADWLFPRMLLEAKDGGFYSQLLLLPTSERDLYKRWGQDEAVLGRFNQLRHGGATVGPSIVARFNRELEELPSGYGWDLKLIWRTRDFATDSDDPTKNVFRSLAGTSIHDGREIIGTLPNGLHWYYVADGKGVQANVVPQAIALDQRNKRGISDPNVTNAIKCFDCHMPSSGIYPFVDQVRSAIIAPDIALAVIAEGERINERGERLAARIKEQFVPVENGREQRHATDPNAQHLDPNAQHPFLSSPPFSGVTPGPFKIHYSPYLDDRARRRVYNRARDLEEFYLGDLQGRIEGQQASYARRLALCSGLRPSDAASAVVEAYNRYHEELVDLEQATRELGYPQEEVVLMLRTSGNPDLALLSRENALPVAASRGGQLIRRAAWERGFDDAIKTVVWPWERILQPVPKPFGY